MLAAFVPGGHGFSASSQAFLGNRLVTGQPFPTTTNTLTMRKQKASDRRTRRMQKGEDVAVDVSSRTITSSPMAAASWQHKKLAPTQRQQSRAGRGRARKRSNLYNTLSSYHSHFLSLLTAEYRAEEEEVLGRIKASADNPLTLEEAGYALFDLYPERRGNLFSDEVYRLSKPSDASTFYSRNDSDGPDKASSGLPLNHKFSANDVIVLTEQPRGTGDFFGANSLPTSSFAISAEARVLSVGPTYVDIAIPGGTFEATFGPAPNNMLGKKGDPRMRLRADLFFSNIPYTRMVQALGQITSIPDVHRLTSGTEGAAAHENIVMDEVVREAILSTFAFNDPSSPNFRDTDACDLREMSKRIAKPPLHISTKLAKQAITHIQSNPQGVFRPFNGPQLTAIEAALTRRLTLIQGPPGTGKTTVASGIAFGFVHQCQSISRNTKVLACAFSNVGADNLAEQMVQLGLKVVRIGKASAVSESLWDYTLDSAIDKDPAAQKALQNAAWATSQLTSSKTQRKGESRSKSSILSERTKREVATTAVKASIEACNIAATKALRDADVIVTTSTGASDPRLLAACGIVATEDEVSSQTARRTPRSSSRLDSLASQQARVNAPDGLPPLSLPFVIVDEACQSVEPASLIPLTSTNSCRSLVLLGDPCQLPPTIRSGTGTSSPLSVSLMERLAATLPHPVIVTAHADHSDKDEKFLVSKPTKQALSLFRDREGHRQERHVSYRKRFGGSLLLSVQYRMHPSISAFSSALFYDGLLSTPSFLANQRGFPVSLHVNLPSDNPVVGVRFIDVGGRSNERLGNRSEDSKAAFVPSPSSVGLGQQTSYWNEEEALQVMSVIKEMLSSHNLTTPCPTSIGVVTPYNGQVELIKLLMSTDKEFKELAKTLSTNIEVKSVDGYQGRERDVIIFSAVRSNRSGKVGFLSDWRRMNVALTRARSALVVVGDLDTLSEGDSHWAAFGKWCHGMKCIVDDVQAQRETTPLS
jgi:regulator of nonsense transcripts 1